MLVLKEGDLLLGVIDLIAVLFPVKQIFHGFTPEGCINDPGYIITGNIGINMAKWFNENAGFNLAETQTTRDPEMDLILPFLFQPEAMGSTTLG